MLRPHDLAASPALHPPPSLSLRPALGWRVSPPPADPADPAAVARALRDYLAPRVGAGELQFAEGPAEIPHGWETYVYRFRLRAGRALPRPFDRPLILRIYASPQGVPRARREFAIQQSMAHHGPAVPEPLLAEQDCDLFGGPFLIMEEVPGETLLDYLRRHNLHILWVARQLAEEHVGLHRRRAEDFPYRAGPFLERRLGELHKMVLAHGLTGLKEGLDWLRAHRPEEPARPAPLHLDFHPINLMVHPDRPTVVLDWSEADVGDRHADVATTVLLLRSAPLQGASLRERLLTPLTRWALARRYLRVYGSCLPLDRRVLRYYLAWAALRRLGVCGMWLREGPQCNGCKPSSIRLVKCGHVETLQDCFRRWTGVEARV
jgi:aminoglycoside phosphotransferase (APT) family kinase protein